MPRLRRSDSSGAGLRRRRAGTGFSYRDAAGHPVSAEERARIELLAIPPAWEEVWISPHPNGHIQATGVDAAGRTQYIYHPFWRQQKDRLKFDRSLSLAESLPSARRMVTSDLRDTEPSQTRALAAAFRMLDSGSLRVGSERYAEQNGSHGLSTLLCCHASVRGDTVCLEFPAKSGQLWDSEIVDADLAAALRSLARQGCGCATAVLEAGADVASTQRRGDQRLRRRAHGWGVHGEGLPHPARHRHRRRSASQRRGRRGR